MAWRLLLALMCVRHVTQQVADQLTTGSEVTSDAGSKAARRSKVAGDSGAGAAPRSEVTANAGPADRKMPPSLPGFELGGGMRRPLTELAAFGVGL